MWIHDVCVCHVRTALYTQIVAAAVIELFLILFLKKERKCMFVCILLRICERR